MYLSHECKGRIITQTSNNSTSAILENDKKEERIVLLQGNFLVTGCL